MTCRNLLRVGGLFCLATLAFTLARAVPVEQQELPVRTHEVMIIHDRTSVVVPGLLKVRAGDTVRLITVGTSARVYMLYKEAFSQNGVVLRSNLLEIDRGDTLILNIMHEEYRGAPWGKSQEEWDDYWEGEGLPLTVPYAVRSIEADAFAEGCSTPVIIIEPPGDDG